MKQLSVDVKEMEKRVRAYANTGFPAMAARKGLQFIDNNFRNQSWAGLPTIPWHQRRKGWFGKNDTGRALLVLKGLMRRSNYAETRAGWVRLYNTAKYAKVHNEGFNGTVTQKVREHQRRITEFGIVGKKQLKTKTNIKFGRADTGDKQTVKAHTRTIHQRIPARPFMPTEARQSSVLNNDITRQVTLDVMKMLKGKL